jgi:hypothetical protein
MKRRRILLLLALVAVAMACVVFWPRGPREPLYQGRRLGEWIRQKSSLVETMTNAHVDNAIRSIGTNALPWLMFELTRPRSKWRAAVNRWVSAAPVAHFRLEVDEERIYMAGLGLRTLGPHAAAALPTLAKYLGDTDCGQTAAFAMAGIGEGALPWLLNAATSTNPAAARHAMDSLEQMPLESEQAIHAKVQLLRGTNSTIRMRAAANLRRSVTRPDLIVRELAVALTDPGPDVQSLASQCLGELGSNARPAVPALLRLMTSTNAPVASAASNAVLRIDPAALPPRGP